MAARHINTFTSRQAQPAY